MPTVYAILGDSNTRKSSTIRALTGTWKKKLTLVATGAGSINVYVLVSSLQEAGIDPQHFIATMNAGTYQNILVPLWVSNRGTLPAGTEYLRQFAATLGWTIQQVVVLGTAHTLHPLHAGTPAPNLIPQATTMATNEIASHIRGWWNWR